MRTSILALTILTGLSCPLAHAAELSTGYGAPIGGSQSTMMFDVVVSTQDVVLRQVGANMQADPGASVFIRPGTHVGNEFSPIGWIEIYNDSTIVGNGNGVETVLDVNDFTMSASQTYAIAIVVPDRQEAGSGTGVLPGTLAASNADLSILEGTLTNANYPDAFVGAFQQAPYVVETTLYYDLAAQAVPVGGAVVPLLAAGLLGVVVWSLRRRRA